MNDVINDFILNLIIVLCEHSFSDLLSPNISGQGLPPVHTPNDMLHPGLSGPKSRTRLVSPDGSLVVAAAVTCTHITIQLFHFQFAKQGSNNISNSKKNKSHLSAFKKMNLSSNAHLMLKKV